MNLVCFFVTVCVYLPKEDMLKNSFRNWFIRDGILLALSFGCFFVQRLTITSASWIIIYHSLYIVYSLKLRKYLPFTPMLYQYFMDFKKNRFLNKFLSIKSKWTVDMKQIIQTWNIIKWIKNLLYISSVEKGHFSTIKKLSINISL